MAMRAPSLRLRPLLLSASLVLACSDDGPGTTTSEETATDTETGSTDGDGDGDPGDGDGDPGDGDGDPGDGDGDPGDGDGDPGDGDGDPGDGDPGDGDGDPGGDGLSCGALASCVQMCMGDQMCQAQCLMDASVEGAAELDALSACVQTNCMNGNPQCVEANCPGELYDCYTGDGTCGELVECSDMCMGDQLCAEDCYYQSTGLAQQQAQQLQNCATNNNCQDEQCVQDNCGAELTGCVGGGADTLPCAVVADCLINCAGDPVCEATCEPATMEAEAEAQALLACAQMQNCADFDCTENACPNEWGECVSGMGTCADAYACVNTCSGNELCGYNCLAETTLMDQFVLGALADCASQSNCDLDDQNCLAMNCGAEVMACGL